MLASLQDMMMQLAFPDLASFEGKLYGLPTIVLGRMKITNKYLKVNNNEEEKSFTKKSSGSNRVNRMLLRERVKCRCTMPRKILFVNYSATYI